MIKIKQIITSFLYIVLSSTVMASECDFIEVLLSDQSIYNMKISKLESQVSGPLTKSDEIVSLSQRDSLVTYPILNLKDIQEIDLARELQSFSGCLNVGNYFTIKEVLKDTYHLKFATAEGMNKTFVRMEGYFEASSEQFFCSIFDYNDFRDWWEIEYGDWTFEVETMGLNFPGSVLVPFQKGFQQDIRCGHSEKFTHLSSMEALLGSLFHRMRDQDYYIIITNSEYSQGTIDHEIAHALYFTDQDYKANSLKALEALKNITLMRTDVLNSAYDILQNLIGPGLMDYHDTVWADEMQAYLSSNWMELFCNSESTVFDKSELHLYFPVIVDLQLNYTDTLSKLSKAYPNTQNLKQEQIYSPKCP